MKDNFQREINYMRLSVTELCNLRCRYCMPEDGICKIDHGLIMTEDEMITAVEAAAELGIIKLRITGGEPLVKKNIVSICARAAKVSGIQEVCVTTNGVLLPKLAKGLRAAGVARLNISLDTLDPDKFNYITRIGKLSDVMDGIKIALNAGYRKLKINTVLIGGFNDNEIRDFARITMDYPIDVRFIELMPMYDSGDFGPKAFIKCDKVLEMLPEAVPVETDGVARLYRMPGAKGNIGLISPVSDHFCAECNRIRLTADGKLKPCLHSNQEINIKGLTKDEMVRKMRETIFAKPERHAKLSFASRSESGRNMNEIGG